MNIILLLGIFLLGLGACSGGALFFLAISGPDKLSKSSSSTLWGLFILGILGGIFLLYSILIQFQVPN